MDPEVPYTASLTRELASLIKLKRLSRTTYSGSDYTRPNLRDDRVRRAKRDVQPRGARVHANFNIPRRAFDSSSRVARQTLCKIGRRAGGFAVR